VGLAVRRGRLSQEGKRRGCAAKLSPDVKVWLGGLLPSVPRCRWVGGLLLLFSVATWLALCMWATGLLTRGAQHGTLKFFVFLGLLVAPVADEIVGVLQYQRYCAANSIRFLDTVDATVNTGLHSADGKWLLGGLEPSQHEERDRLNRLQESLLDHQLGLYDPTSMLSLVSKRTDRIYEARSGRLLAEVTSYHYPGGFLRRHLLGYSNQCFPEGFDNSMYPRLFSFRVS